MKSKRKRIGINNMNTPTLKTERLILRKFTENDVAALYKMYSDKEVNRFLPWFPLKTMADARLLYERQLAVKYAQTCAYNYAVCLQEDNVPIGYVHVSTDDGYDFGYGLCKEFWHRGIATEAGRAVIGQLKNDGIPYITATHDRNNPRSGDVMKRLGMQYQYSYEEQWQPKDILVIFRMYQRNLDGVEGRVYEQYRKRAAVHFIEKNV